ncbi:hypothetical protein DMH26_01910 [Streptomyces sp. WAC 05379]|uniref:hypothetical protein n=1 Tax=Streptomyces sp. WAC 05379 TaxID=2203207 RepID=UPI000F74A79C|nr:hypothetical protein [Streptomyces sp. WAC 05379]RSO09112.1 hypothetical protein DMH26_01910 [Streptomyces sp. WAC 05379]
MLTWADELNFLLGFSDLLPQDRYVGERMLGSLYLRAFHETNDAQALEYSIDLFRSVFSFSGTGLDRISDIATLAEGLRLRFWISGTVDDLNEAVSLLRTARELSLALPNLPKPTTREALIYLFRLPGKYRVVRRLQSSDWIPAIGHANVASSLADALHMRFTAYQQISDLDEAVAASMDAIELTSSVGLAGGADEDENRLSRAKYLSNLGVYLVERYEAVGHAEDLEFSVKCLREADMLLPPDDRESTTMARNFVRGLCVRGRVTSTLADIEEAATVLNRRDPDHEIWESAVNVQLGRALLNGKVSDLDSAIKRMIEVADGIRTGTVQDSPHRCTLLSLLASALEHRARYLADTRDDDTVGSLHQAEAAWQEAALVAAAPARQRLSAAQGWANLAMRSQPGSPSAIEAVTMAVETLPVAAWRGLDRASQEGVLASVGEHVATDAAAALLAANAPERALELLELGRGVLWSHGLDLRTDLESLRRWDQNLADELTRVRMLLESEVSLEARAGIELQDWPANL